MNERLVDMLLVIEDAFYIRQERLAGDPDREPDETTNEDVTEAFARRKTAPIEVIRKKDICTDALRLMIKSSH
ncbi:MAG TPA: hypothetical protein VLF88_00975 [Candidatus Babeliales bacterium]|nr:hypothetical protein [Candidatus Babeliales bacterium]